eukprot:TRINITY_DN10943_c0_g1_i8.p1 TRINITY_DN10943_c0_g1~~TRINITY_DN10943_c0_g1_i8.p1  ORF type:complete len:203 (-),score=21.60 TRINITY_DN10943_c0_g1_i8:356-964(-)
MADKEIISLHRQLQYCYHHNQELAQQCKMSFTSFGGKLEERLKLSHYEQWPGVETHQTSFDQVFDRQQMVYLTAESENTIHTLDPTKLYIIGAVVDKNRHKGMCEKLAVESAISTARLPIQEHIDMKARVVITVDQVFLILAKLYNGSSMAEALAAAMPTRKGWELKDDETQTEPPAQLEQTCTQATHGEPSSVLVPKGAQV